MTLENKLALIMAYQNAAAMIDGHGEEGGIGEDSFEDFTIAQYLKACNKVANRLERIADKMLADISKNNNIKL